MDEAHTVSPEFEQIAPLLQDFGLQEVYFMITTGTFYKEIVKLYKVLVQKEIVLLEVNVPMFPIHKLFDQHEYKQKEELIPAMVDYLILKNKESMEESHFLVFRTGENFINAMYTTLQG